MTVNRYLTIKYWERRGIYSAPSERELKDNYEDEAFHVIDNPEGIIWEFDAELDKRVPILKIKNQAFGHTYSERLVYIGDGLYVAKAIVRDNENLLAAGFEQIPKEVLSMETPLWV